MFQAPKILDQKNGCLEINFSSENVLGLKKLWDPKKLDPEKFKKNAVSKNFFVGTNLRSKKIVLKNCGPKKILCRKEIRIY